MSLIDWICAFLVLMIWGSSSSLVAVFTNNAHPLVLSGMVVIIAFVLLSGQFIFDSNRELLKKYSFKDWLVLFVPALLGLFFYPVAYFAGISGSSPIKANVLNYLWPFIAFVLSGIIHKKKFKRYDVLAIVLSAIGGYIVLWSNQATAASGQNDMKYALIALSGAAFYGVYTAIIDLFLPKYRAEVTDEEGITYIQEIKMPALLRMWVMILWVTLIYIPIFIYLFLKTDIVLSSFTNILSEKSSIQAFILYAVINFTFAHFLWNRLNTSVNISLTSSMAFLTPLLSTVILARSVNNQIGIPLAVGLLLIVASIIINNRHQVNSINLTFVSVLVFIIMDGVLPILLNRT